MLAGGGVICLRFAVFGHFLCGYAVLGPVFCGFAVSGRLLRFAILAIFCAVMRFQVILLAVLGYQCILFCDFTDLIDLTYIHL